MTKLKFLMSLHDRLSGLPQNEVEERLSFYSEMIDDRIEEGLSEEDAVSQVGDVDKIVSQIIADIPLTKIAIEKIKPKRKLLAWEIVLLAVGSPIWLSLLISFFAVIFSVYASIWAVVASLWAVFGSFVASSVAGFFGGIGLLFVKKGPVGVACCGVGIALVGLSILMFYASLWATKGMVILTKKSILGIKHCFVRKENRK